MSTPPSPKVNATPDYFHYFFTYFSVSGFDLTLCWFKKPQRPYVRSRRLKGDTDKAQAAEKQAKEKISEKAVSRISAGTKRKSADVESPLEIVNVEDPLPKRTKADQIGIAVPFTNIS